jgi:acyl-CoA thioester hydrolase
MRGDELLVEASVRVAFISGGRARPIPKPLRIAMRADHEVITLAEGKRETY